jgi:hypothetical protein
VKADRATKSGLRVGMRLMTRNLGQVTNAKEVILRVVSVFPMFSQGPRLMIDQRHQ